MNMTIPHPPYKPERFIKDGDYTNTRCSIISLSASPMPSSMVKRNCSCKSSRHPLLQEVHDKNTPVSRTSHFLNHLLESCTDKSTVVRMIRSNQVICMLANFTRSFVRSRTRSFCWTDLRERLYYKVWMDTRWVWKQNRRMWFWSTRKQFSKKF